MLPVTEWAHPPQHLHNALCRLDVKVGRQAEHSSSHTEEASFSASSVDVCVGGRETFAAYCCEVRYSD